MNIRFDELSYVSAHFRIIFFEFKVCSVKTISKNAENDADKTTIIAFSRNISAAYRQLVHIEAAKLQLHHGSHGVGDERYVVVSKESPQKHRDKCLGNVSYVSYIHTCIEL